MEHNTLGGLACSFFFLFLFCNWQSKLPVASDLRRVCVCVFSALDLSFSDAESQGKELLRSDGIIVSVVGSCAHTPEGTTFP